MSSPVLSASYSGAPSTHGTYPTPSFTPPANAILVAKACTQDSGYAFTSGSVTDSVGLTWTAALDNSTPNWCGAILSWAQVGASPVPMTVSFTQATIPGNGWAWVLEIWTGGAVSTTATDVRISSGASTTSVTTHSNGSVLTCFDADWNDINGASRAYVAGTSEDDYYYSAGKVTFYSFYNTEANAGAYTIGVTAPTGQRSTIMTLELQPALVPTLVSDSDALTGTDSNTGGSIDLTGGETFEFGSLHDAGEGVLQTSPYAPGADTGSGSEAAHISVASSDAGSGAEAASAQLFVVVFVSDTDSSRKPGSVVPVTVNASDTASGTDLEAKLKVVDSDTGFCLDGKAIPSPVSASDAFSGDDEVFPYLNPADIDSGAGTESSTGIPAALSATDAALGTDGKLSGLPAGADAAAGSDAATTLVVFLSGSDSASALDAGSFSGGGSTSFFSADAGSSAETAIAAPTGWIMTAWNIHLIANNPSDAAAAALLNTPFTFATASNYTSSPVLDGYTSTPVFRYTSFSQFSSDITTGALTYPYRWVLYDTEDWSNTPQAEIDNPWHYMALFSQLAHSVGMRSIITPARDLGNDATSLYPKAGGETLDQWCVRTNLFGSCAAGIDLNAHPGAVGYGADIVVVQTQADTTTGTFASFFASCLAQIQAAAPYTCQPWAELSTNFGTQVQEISAGQSVIYAHGAQGFFFSSTTALVDQAAAVIAAIG